MPGLQNIFRPFFDGKGLVISVSYVHVPRVYYAFLPVVIRLLNTFERIKGNSKT